MQTGLQRIRTMRRKPVLFFSFRVWTETPRNPCATG